MTTTDHPIPDGIDRSFLDDAVSADLRDRATPDQRTWLEDNSDVWHAWLSRVAGNVDGQLERWQERIDAGTLERTPETLAWRGRTRQFRKHLLRKVDEVERLRADRARLLDEAVADAVNDLEAGDAAAALSRLRAVS